MSALADGLISEPRAGELLGMPVRNFLSKELRCTGDGWLGHVTDANLWIYLLCAEIEGRVFRPPWEFMAPDVMLAEINYREGDASNSYQAYISPRSTSREAFFRSSEAIRE